MDFVVVGYSLWGGGKISGSGSKFNCAARVGSDDLGYGPGSGFSLKPVQTSTQWLFLDETPQKSTFAHLRFEVGLLWRPEHISRGDIQMQKDLPEGRPVSGFTLPAGTRRTPSQSTNTTLF